MTAREGNGDRAGAAWRPALGAWLSGDGARFRLWAPTREAVELILEGPGTVHRLDKQEDGTFAGLLPGVRAGDRYRYRVDGRGPFPDPASRFQPEGVHGPSEVVDGQTFRWTDSGWTGIALEDLVLYELHVGTFTPAGTYAGVVDRLPYLRDLGVTAIELLPLGDFPGERNWGYDGVAPFAPARGYGRPDDLRRLVDEAHRHRLAVLLDVVYNHFGPDGAYVGQFSPHYFSARKPTPWGAALNLDGDHARGVREFLIENALHWVHEYHLDGLRLDATHALRDEGARHVLVEMQSRLRASARERRLLLIAEDNRNRPRLVRPEAEGGYGLDAQWSDDFHHQLRRILAGDHEGYYADYRGSVADLAKTVRDGWLYRGEYSVYRKQDWGEDPAGLSPRRFVFYLQNHDQVGNRAHGERLHHEIDSAAWRAASVLLLTAPEVPLLFMGQEWSAPSPFLFFTDHHERLGARIGEGRRKEFSDFAAFAEPAVRERIPHPQDPETFRRSRLDWPRLEQPPHAATRRLYGALLRLRRGEPLLRAATWEGFDARALGEEGLVLERRGDGGRVVVLVRLKGDGPLAAPAPAGEPWEVLLTTEDEGFCPDPRPIEVDAAGACFPRPGAVILKARR
jgi:maltooligosyltrehalose trehalohydrolase